MLTTPKRSLPKFFHGKRLRLQPFRRPFPTLHLVRGRPAPSLPRWGVPRGLQPTNSGRHQRQGGSAAQSASGASTLLRRPEGLPGFPPQPRLESPASLSTIDGATMRLCRADPPCPSAVRRGRPVPLVPGLPRWGPPRGGCREEAAPAAFIVTKSTAQREGRLYRRWRQVVHGHCS